MARDPLAGVGARVIEVLLEDEVFVRHVAEQAIETEVAAGTLLRTDSLRAMPLELVPTGEMARLRSLLFRLRDAVATRTPKATMMALIEEIALVEAGAAPPAAPASTTPTPADPGPTIQEDPTVDDGRVRRPRELPEGDGVCSKCETGIDQAQRRMSWTRFREELCRPCMAAHPQAAKIRAA